MSRNDRNPMVPSLNYMVVAVGHPSQDQIIFDVQPKTQAVLCCRGEKQLLCDQQISIAFARQIASSHRVSSHIFPSKLFGYVAQCLYIPTSDTTFSFECEYQTSELLMQIYLNDSETVLRIYAISQLDGPYLVNINNGWST